MKLLRTIRLDPSDSFVFDRAAAPGEWAVPASFEFWGTDPGLLAGKSRQAFRAGFLGLASFGWSTLVIAQEATAAERAAATECLAAYLVKAHGAPDVGAALAAAAEEIAYAASLAEHPQGTLIAIHRSVEADGSIRERFRTLHPADARTASAMPCSAGAFAIVEADAETHEDPSEPVSLLDLAAARERAP